MPIRQGPRGDIVSINTKLNRLLKNVVLVIILALYICKVLLRSCVNQFNLAFGKGESETLIFGAYGGGEMKVLDPLGNWK